MLTDASNIYSDYPTLNSTTHEIDVRNDPDGLNTLLFTETTSLASLDILRIKILKNTSGVIPSKMRFAIRANHTYESVSYDSFYDLVWDFTITSSLSGQFNFGALDTNDVSNVYTADAAGTHNFSLTSSFTVGDVEYRVNSGTWTQLIAAGNTAGSIAGVSISDTIEIRHQSTDTDALKQIDMVPPGGGTSAYGILYT